MKKKKILKISIIAMVVSLLCGGGYVAYSKFFSKETAKTTNKTYTANVTKQDLKVRVEGTGSAYSGTTKDVMANNKGTLSSLSVKVGDTVTKGQKIFVCTSNELTSAVTTAQNNLAKQNLTLASDEASDKVDENKIAMDKIAVSDAITQLADAKKQYASITVTAPIAGTVTAVNYSNGDELDGTKAILTIVDMNSLKIKVSVDELDILKVKKGQTAEIVFSAVEDKTYVGAVESISETGTTSNNVTTYDVLVSVNEPAGIKIGMNGTVTVAVESKEKALVIPVEALVQQNGEKFVKIKSTEDNTKTSLVAIKTGIETQDYIEVTEGLTEGDKVIISLPSNSISTNQKQGMGGGEMGNPPSGAMGAPTGNMGAPSGKN